ncbi:multidrug effflux MFS transporter [Photobacterium sp. TY 1-4]|uniref:Bcr/CflA family efflux transporter n=2 Tax=Pseudosulfitobacter koreensis TaxID=2968472 RepID=A0ABT1Z1Z5_9RHOB|nr:multidrug effflux MFS transporter [Pseudosulfitobacter koreense]
MDTARGAIYLPEMQRIPTVRFLKRSTPPHLITLVMLAGMSAMVMNMFLPSLPNMTEYFDTEYRLMQLSVALFLGVSAVMQVLIGPISDSLGRRPVLLGGLSLFLVATLGCIYAPTAEIFLFFRMCQAVVAVAMVLSRAVIRDLYDQNESASMIGIVTMFMSVVPMVSPAIGGVLDELFGWRANFWAFFIIGAITLWVVWADLGETATSTGKTLGAQFREYPELLRSPRFWGYALASGFCSGSFFAYLGGAPFVGSVLFNMSPSMLGLVFGAPAIGYMVGNAITGAFATRYGVNRMVLVGCFSNFIGVAGSLALFAVGLGSPWSFFGMMMFVGLGNGLVIPNATAGMLSVRPHLAGTASGLGGAIQIGGGALLSGLVGTLLTPETGAFPLLYMMTITSVLAMVSIGTVYWRERQIAPDALPD